ncbi:hypothetical protein K1W54_02585 [Micromonospora sp. CPCC 205371]|nr:hypothetical protein [Micromonospora sp. CPCC 205371]
MIEPLPDDVAEIRALAAAVTSPGDELTRVHLIESRAEPWAAGSVNRAGGPPVGGAEETPAPLGGNYMQHLLPVGPATAPQLRSTKALADARAVALFISDARDNGAFEENTQETAVVVLTEEDVAKGEWVGPPVGDPAPQAFDLYAVDVPARVFGEPDFDTYDEGDGPLGGGYESAEMEELASRLLSADRLGGAVMHALDSEPGDDFIGQISEFVVDVNLGDAGTMFIFASRAFWTSL